MVKSVEAPKQTRKSRTSGLRRIAGPKGRPPQTKLSDINDHCLMGIFDFLDIASLVKMCKLGERFRDIICHTILPLKTVKFSELSMYSTRKIFEEFGKWMTHIEICNKDIQYTQPNTTPFIECLRLITVYCTPGRLQHLYIYGFGDGENPIIPADLINALQPCLSNVHTLHFDMKKHMVVFNNFMSIMPKQNLRHFFAHNVRVVGEWLTVKSLPRLQTFHMCMGQNPFELFYDTINLNRLKAYIVGKPALNRFEYEGKNNEALIVELSRHVPYADFIGTVKNQLVSMDDDNNNNIWSKSQSLREKWKFLDDLPNLKEFRLESYSQNFENCGEIFRILGSRNTIEKLELITGYTSQSSINPVDLANLRQLTKVKSLNLLNFGRAHSDEFLNQLFENLTGLTECSFIDGSIKQAVIGNVIQMARNLQVLNIHSKVKFSARIYKRMVKIRKAIDPARSDRPLIINIDKDIADGCITELGNRSYKPSIIVLKHIKR